MIKAVKICKEVVVTVVNKIGVLADMSDLLSRQGINIEAVAGYAVNSEAKIMLVVADNLKAVNALKKSGYNSLKENDVIIVELENKPGALKVISAKLAAEGVDIKMIYGTVCSAGCPAKIVLSTSDNNKAVGALKK